MEKADLSKPSKPVQNPQLRAIKYQTTEISITAAAASSTSPARYSATIETDKQYKRLVGVQLTIIDSATGVIVENLRIKRFEINSKDIYSDGHPVKCLINTNDVNPNDKFDRDINETAEGNKVNIDLDEYTVSSFVAYKVAVTLMLSNKPEHIPAP